jgi:O-antigen/teichoic acid export membrane protein
MLRQGLFFVVIITYFLILRPFNLVELAWWQLLSSAMASLLSFYFVRNYWVSSNGIPWEWVKKLFNFGKYVFGTNLSAMIFQSIDHFMIGKYLGTAPAGLFNVSMRITNLVDVPISTVVSVVFPQSSKFQGEHQKRDMKDMFEKSTGFMLALILPACLVTLIFPELIITIIAGENYAVEGTNVLRVTILSIMVQPFLRQFGTMLDSSGKPEINFYALLGMAVLNVVLNVVFIQKFGIMGAAYGTLTSMVVFAILARFILKANFNISFIASLKYIFVFYGKAFTYLKNLGPNK